MPHPNDDQLCAFGAIIHYYACAESGIKIALAGMLRIDLVELLILTEPHSSMDLRNVAKSIAKERFKLTPEVERFCQLVGDLGAFGALRNAVAHSRWTKGARQCSIKPFRVDIRSGSARFIGDDDEERDWTADELTEQGQKLFELNHRIVQFMKETGIAAAMERKDATISEAMDESGGSSTNDS